MRTPTQGPAVFQHQGQLHTHWLSQTFRSPCLLGVGGVAVSLALILSLVAGRRVGISHLLPLPWRGRKACILYGHLQSMKNEWKWGRGDHVSLRDEGHSLFPLERISRFCLTVRKKGGEKWRSPGLGVLRVSLGSPSSQLYGLGQPTCPL